MYLFVAKNLSNSHQMHSLMSLIIAPTPEYGFTKIGHSASDKHRHIFYVKRAASVRSRKLHHAVYKHGGDDGMWFRTVKVTLFPLIFQESLWYLTLRVTHIFVPPTHIFLTNNIALLGLCHNHFFHLGEKLVLILPALPTSCDLYQNHWCHIEIRSVCYRLKVLHIYLYSPKLISLSLILH